MMRRRDPRRRAAAVVEFAVVLPLLITILFGIIEYGWVFMVRQALQTAAREGARVGTLQTATEAQVLARVTDVMAPTGLTPSFTFQDATAVDPEVRVSLSVQYSDVSLLGDFFNHGSGALGGVCSMRKEGWVPP